MDDRSSLILLMGRMDGKLDALIGQHGKLDERIDEIETRLEGLEKKQATGRAWLAGVVAALSAIATLVFSNFTGIKEFFNVKG